MILRTLHCRNPFLAFSSRSSSYTHLGSKMAVKQIRQPCGQVPRELQGQLPPFLGGALHGSHIFQRMIQQLVCSPKRSVFVLVLFASQAIS